MSLAGQKKSVALICFSCFRPQATHAGRHAHKQTDTHTHASTHRHRHRQEHTNTHTHARARAHAHTHMQFTLLRSSSAPGMSEPLGALPGAWHPGACWHPWIHCQSATNATYTQAWVESVPGSTVALATRSGLWSSSLDPNQPQTWQKLSTLPGTAGTRVV